LAAGRREIRRGRDVDFGSSEGDRRKMGKKSAAELVASLAANHRVLMLGGLAVISHGNTRPTIDADVWLDSSLPNDAWVNAVNDLVSGHALQLISIGGWEPVAPSELLDVILSDRVVRVVGADQPLDIFREPNELGLLEFDDVWDRAMPMDDGTRVPDPIDLLVTKQDTGREKDWLDIAFLEKKAEGQYLELLPTAEEGTALMMLERFLTPTVAEAAIAHPAPAVRAAGQRYLHELAEAGDPFAAEALRRLESH